jgi:hypothetical protein
MFDMKRSPYYLLFQLELQNCISLNDEMKKNILKVVSSQDEKVHTHVNRDMTYHMKK